MCHAQASTHMLAPTSCNASAEPFERSKSNKAVRHRLVAAVHPKGLSNWAVQIMTRRCVPHSQRSRNAVLISPLAPSQVWIVEHLDTILWCLVTPCSHMSEYADSRASAGTSNAVRWASEETSPALASHNARSTVSTLILQYHVQPHPSTTGVYCAV